MAERALLESMSRFELLADTASSLLQTPEPKKAIEKLCRKVMEHIDCEIFLNFLSDEHKEKLNLNSWAGISSKEARCIMSVDYDTTICGASARESSRMVIEHIQDSSDERTKMLRALGIRAYVCQPLAGEGGKVIGTLCFATKKRNTFREEDLSLMKAVADQVAAAMMRLSQ
jgi:GAF domain-containing protein